MVHVVTEKRDTRQKLSFLSNLLMKRTFYGIGLLLLLIVFIVPVIRLFWMSFKTKEGMSFHNYTSILMDASTWTMLQNTIIVVTGSTFIAVVLGVTVAWMMVYTDIRQKKVLQLFIILPFIIPSYIVTIAWTQFVGNIPFLNLNLYSYAGIIFVLGISHYPLVYLFTANVLKRIPKELEWAVRASGGGRWVAFRKVTLPLALPGVVGGGMIAFLTNLDNFGIPAFLGIPANITVLSTAIYQEVIGFGPSSFSRAATLSVILLVIALLGTGIQWLLLRKSKVSETAPVDHTPRFHLGKGRGWVEVVVWLFVVGISIIPLLSMVKTSVIRAYGLPFKWEHVTLKHYQYVLFEYDKALQAIGTSVKLALITTIVCLLFGTMIAYFRTRNHSRMMRLVEGSIGLPYALPGMVLALAMIFMWMQPIPGWNPGIYGSIWILFIAYSTRFMILQVRGSMTAMSQVSVDLEEAAHVFGAGTFVKWKSILIPLLFGGMMSGAFLVLLTALTELTVSSLLWSSGTETIGVIIFNFEQAGYTTHSTAFSIILLIMMLLLAMIVYGLQALWKWKVKRA